MSIYADRATSLAQLVDEHRFRSLSIYEPGSKGPFRRMFCSLPNYTRSEYLPGVASGASSDGRRCEDLMALSFPDATFDLVVTSDIFEHVRHPLAAFAEVHRVLVPGGTHVFTVPGHWPLRSTTTPRVDVSGPEDVLVLEPRYHGPSLVYNDFGVDLLSELDEIGFATDVHRFACSDPDAARAVTFCSTKRELRRVERVARMLQSGPSRLGSAVARLGGRCRAVLAR